MKHRSLRKRLLLWFVALASSLVAAATAALYTGTRSALLDGLDAELRARAEGIGARTECEDGAIAIESDGPGEDALPQVDGFEVRMWPGLAPALQRGTSLPPCTIADALGAATLGDLRVVGVRVDRPARSEDGEPPDEPFAVLVRTARSTQHLQRQLDRVWLIALATLLAGLGAVVAFGVVVSRRVVGPLQRLAQAASGVQRGETLPMPDRGTGDEVDHLASVLDNAFAALRAATERQRRFTADASHELRNPLAIVRTTAEVALHRPRDAADYQQTLGEVVTGAKRMQAMLEALLLLARLDAGSAVATADLDLRALAQDAITTAPGRHGVAMDLVEGQITPIRGDAQLLAMLIGNLLANALRHARSRVWVQVASDDHGQRLFVEDDGAGLPPDERNRLFERFFRGRNSAGHAGSGLGLAIVAAIANSHRATVHAEDAAPGLRICVTFPKQEPSEIIHS